jgi:tRNA(fMet)-specific endonuclease VapC
MAGKLLLDTNAVIAQLGGDPSILAAIDGFDIYVPLPALAELYFGAEKSARVNENIQRLDRYVAAAVVLTANLRTAHQWGKVRNNLRLKGRPIPTNDIWIAAIAVQANLTLVTRDAHFNQVDGLQVLSW